MTGKTTVLILIVVLSLLTGIATEYFFPGDVQSPADLAFVIGFSALLFTWYLIDTKQLAYKRSAFLDVAVFGLALFALPYYLIRSRGVKGGLVATALFLTGVMGAAAISIAGQYSTYAFQS